MPDPANVEKDIVSAFCHFVHFFPARAAGEAWAAQHPGTFILSLAEAHAVARRKNQAQYASQTGTCGRNPLCRRRSSPERGRRSGKVPDNLFNARWA